MQRSQGLSTRQIAGDRDSEDRSASRAPEDRSGSRESEDPPARRESEDRAAIQDDTDREPDRSATSDHASSTADLATESLALLPHNEDTDFQRADPDRLRRSAPAHRRAGRRTRGRGHAAPRRRLRGRARASRRAVGPRRRRLHGRPPHRAPALSQLLSAPALRSPAASWARWTGRRVEPPCCGPRTARDAHSGARPAG